MTLLLKIDYVVYQKLHMNFYNEFINFILLIENIIVYYYKPAYLFIMLIFDFCKLLPNYLYF